jgi:hypothetical protein
MHHFIYPSKDTYITNRTNYESKNFGIDELLQVGTANTIVRTLSSTKDFVYTNVVFNNQGVQNFTGTLTGSFTGTISASFGTVSGSGLIFSASYFSGSVDGTGSVGSGSFGDPASGSAVIGTLSGSIIAPFSLGLFIGTLSGSNACLSGTGSGTDTRNISNWQDATTKFVDRTLIKFDLNAISASIVEGGIAVPRFGLKVKVCNEYELPITYTIYALPVSQSWEMGNGYYSDGGSDRGVSWQYRDNNGGTTWYSQSLSGSRPAIDFIADPTLATASFAYGGGTFYTSSICSQSFQYQSSDINMDVTTLVYSWLSGSVPNEGLMLVSSDELQSTGSGFTLRFFSRDTNTIYSPVLDVMWDDIALNGGDITGSISTGSITISTGSAGITASIQSGSTFTIAGGISGSFSASAFLTFTQNFDSASVLLPDLSASGIVSGGGLSGNIIGLPVFGFVSASISSSASLVNGPCGNNFYAQSSTGSFYNGIFSGSTFTAWYVDYKFENAFLTGSWTPEALYGARVYIGIPSGIEPYAYATVIGTYVNGRAMGTYTLSGSTSASFYGQFIDGNLIGGVINLQLSGSIYTASFSYTSSVELTSSVLTPLEAERPFTVTLTNVRPTYKAGDLAKMNVFARKQFPLKTFGKSTQQAQYLVPEFLPTSSYYALKDNETGEILMDFDNYTRIGCMYPEGNYFVLDTTALPQERYYRVLIRVNDGTSITTIDTGKTFKVTR